MTALRKSNISCIDLPSFGGRGAGGSSERGLVTEMIRYVQDVMIWFESQDIIEISIISSWTLRMHSPEQTYD